MLSVRRFDPASGLELVAKGTWLAPHRGFYCLTGGRLVVRLVGGKGETTTFSVPRGGGIVPMLAYWVEKETTVRGIYAMR